MRTYSLTVPLEERTFTVLGYMRTIITTNHGESREICGNSRKTLNQIVTTIFGPTGSPFARRTWKTRRFRAREPPAWVASPQTWEDDQPGEGRQDRGALAERGAD